MLLCSLSSRLLTIRDSCSSLTLLYPAASILCTGSMLLQSCCVRTSSVDIALVFILRAQVQFCHTYMHMSSPEVCKLTHVCCLSRSCNACMQVPSNGGAWVQQTTCSACQSPPQLISISEASAPQDTAPAYRMYLALTPMQLAIPLPRPRVASAETPPWCLYLQIRPARQVATAPPLRRRPAKLLSEAAQARRRP